MGKAQTSEFIPFDEQRYSGDFRRADIVFGPDMFNPLITDGYTPLADALDEALDQDRLVDLGVTKHNISKTVGDVFGGMEPQEIRARCLEISRRLEPKPPTSTPPKGFLERLLSFAG